MRWVTLALVIPLSVAGCSGDSENAGAADGDALLDEAGNATLNLRPLPSFDADALEGPAPLTVNFTLDGADPDGDALNWSLDADGDGTAEFNGTALPASVNHTYQANGSFNATFLLTDGSLTAQASITINVTAEAAAYAAQPPVTFTGSVSGAAGAGPTGSADHTFEVGAGQRLIHATIAYGTGCGGDIDWALLDPNGAEADSSASSSATGEDPLDAEDPAPGTWTIHVEAFASACPSYTVTVAFE